MNEWTNAELIAEMGELHIKNLNIAISFTCKFQIL